MVEGGNPKPKVPPVGKWKKIDVAMEWYAGDGPNAAFYTRNPFGQELPWQFGADHGVGEDRLPIPPLWPRWNRSGGRCFKEIHR